MRGGIKYVMDTFKAVLPDSSVEARSTVSILGRSETFRGDDIGDVEQRMPFVLSLAKDLMTAYANDQQGMTGHQRIFVDQQKVILDTYGAERYLDSLRQRTRTLNYNTPRKWYTA